MTGQSTIREFEQLFASICERKYCIATGNASISILGVCWAMGLTGQQVIVPAITWPGAITPLQILGCKIICCDVEDDFLTMDPVKLEALVTPETKAVFSADFMGYPCKTDRIAEICRKKKVLYFHDAASALGSRYKGKQAGYFADVAIYSFGARKLYSCGEGGAIVYSKSHIHKKLRTQLLHPDRQINEIENPNWFFFNISMNSVIAASNIRRIEKSIRKIREEALRTRKLLGQNIHGESEPNFYKILVKRKEAFKYKGKFPAGEPVNQKPIYKMLNPKVAKKKFKIAERVNTDYIYLIKQSL